jgi:Tol biopolymer transport system component
VVFGSLATNLVPGDSNNSNDVFLRDRLTGQTVVISQSSDGTQGNSDSWTPSISADGRFVSFSSAATNLVTADNNGEIDIFLYDRQTGQTELISQSSDGTRGNSYSRSPSISAHGRFVVFFSASTNLVPADTNEVDDVFLRDLWGGSSNNLFLPVIIR